MIAKTAGGCYQIPCNGLTHLKLERQENLSWRVTAFPETEKVVRANAYSCERTVISQRIEGWL
jgi:hypothetical protein